MSVSKKKRLEEARASLDVAKKQLSQAQVAWWDPPEPAVCVTNAFYAYENAVTAALVAVGTKRTKRHVEKAALAKQLFEENKLKTDVSQRLEHLNEARKDVQYGEAGPELSGIDLEDLVSELEGFINEVETLIGEIEEG